jgi:hypothetical protein
MAALCEVSYPKAGIVPELSFGSHFFQDIVESNIFYAAIFDGEEGIVFRPDQVLSRENVFAEIYSGEKKWGSVVHIAQTPALTLHSDITNQKLLIYWD